jgi:Rap1a immunity proteins
MLKYLTILVALLALTAANAAEENLAIDGKKFMDLCNTTDQKMLAVCASFTLGVSDTLAVWRALHPSTARVCVPNAVQLNQMIDVGLDYVQRFPAERHLSAARLLLVAFTDAWPCKRR